MFTYLLVIYSFFNIAARFPLNPLRCINDDDCPWDMCLHTNLDRICINDACFCG